MKKIIFFDFDGPILDVSEKFYRVYQDILQEEGYKTLSKADYWFNKRNKTPEQNTLEQTEADQFYERYQTERVNRIETQHYLRFDKLQPDVESVLKELAKEYHLILVTLRSNHSMVLWQLEEFGIKSYFHDVLSSSAHGINEKWKVKVRLIRDAGFSEGELVAFVGDTETDINAGRHLGCITIAVDFGIRKPETLRLSSPDWIINVPGQIPALL